MRKNINVLLGKILKNVNIDKQNDKIIFTLEDGKQYKMYHDQGCCENVYIEDVCGDINDLINSELLISEEISNNEEAKDKYDESFTWTFYKFATIKGYVTIRWYGTSNGYYSESVDFEEVN